MVTVPRRSHAERPERAPGPYSRTYGAATRVRRREGGRSRRAAGQRRRRCSPSRVPVDDAVQHRRSRTAGQRCRTPGRSHRRSGRTPSRTSKQRTGPLEVDDQRADSSAQLGLPLAPHAGSSAASAQSSPPTSVSASGCAARAGPAVRRRVDHRAHPPARPAVAVAGPTRRARSGDQGGRSSRRPGPGTTSSRWPVRARQSHQHRGGAERRAARPGRTRPTTGRARRRRRPRVGRRPG